MKLVKKVLVPTDFSELSRAGVRYALEMAGSDGAEAIVLHVADYSKALPSSFPEVSSQAHYKTVENFIDEHKESIDKFLAENFPELVTKVKIQKEVEFGTPSEKIVEKAEKLGADMIVMSTHGRTGLSHMLIGSVTEHVVQRSSCPVLSIRPPKTG